MEGLVQRWGIPIALYGDRHGVFKFAGKPRHIQPPVETTHFSRGMQELACTDLRPLSPGQGPRGAHGRDFSGPTGG